MINISVDFSLFLNDEKIKVDYYHYHQKVNTLKNRELRNVGNKLGTVENCSINVEGGENQSYVYFLQTTDDYRRHQYMLITSPKQLQKLEEQFPEFPYSREHHLFTLRNSKFEKLEGMKDQVAHILALVISSTEQVKKLGN